MSGGFSSSQRKQKALCISCSQVLSSSCFGKTEWARIKVCAFIASRHLPARQLKLGSRSIQIEKLMHFFCEQASWKFFVWSVMRGARR